MNTEMKIFETEIKDIQELQAKARKYDELKEAMGKIKKEIPKRQSEIPYKVSTYEGGIHEGLEEALRIFKHFTEGLI